MFLTEAARHNALPLDDRRAERFDPDRAGRPQLIKGRTQLLYGGMSRLSESSVVSVKNKSHAVSCQIVVGEDGDSGTLIAQGGKFGGWTVYLTTDGRPAYCYNLFGLQKFKVSGDEAVAEGERQVRMKFDYDGDGVGKGGTDAATGVTDDLDKSTSTFTGEVKWVQIDLGDAAEDFDHMVTADERYRIAMSRQ